MKALEEFQLNPEKTGVPWESLAANKCVWKSLLCPNSFYNGVTPSAAAEARARAARPDPTTRTGRTGSSTRTRTGDAPRRRRRNPAEYVEVPCMDIPGPVHNSLLPELAVVGCETSSHNTPASDSMITEPSASTSWATHKHSNGSMMQLLPTSRVNRTPPCLPPRLQTETRPPVQVLVRVPAPAGHPLPQFGTAAPS